jgi:hypothetical protein
LLVTTDSGTLPLLDTAATLIHSLPMSMPMTVGSAHCAATERGQRTLQVAPAALIRIGGFGGQCGRQWASPLRASTRQRAKGRELTNSAACPGSGYFPLEGSYLSSTGTYRSVRGMTTVRLDTCRRRQLTSTHMHAHVYTRSAKSAATTVSVAAHESSLQLNAYWARMARQHMSNACGMRHTRAHWAADLFWWGLC